MFEFYYVDLLLIKLFVFGLFENVVFEFFFGWKDKNFGKMV